MLVQVPIEILLGARAWKDLLWRQVSSPFLGHAFELFVYVTFGILLLFRVHVILLADLKFIL